MHKFEIFNRISQELEINRGKEEQEQSWHCRLAYSAAARRGLVSLWDQGDQRVSLEHLSRTIEQVLTSFRMLFQEVDDVFNALERKTNDKLSAQICDCLQGSGCLYHKAYCVAPAAPACAIEGEISFLRGQSPGERCFMSGAGCYRTGGDDKPDKDILSMFGLQKLPSAGDLMNFAASLKEERRSSLEDREFLCLVPSKLHNGFWQDKPDRGILSLLRRKIGDKEYSLYFFDGKTYLCYVLPDYWNEKNNYAILASGLLSRNKMIHFGTRKSDKLVFINSYYVLPPTVEYFFHLYSWPDFCFKSQDSGIFATRIMDCEVYKSFFSIMTRLGYCFKEFTYV